MSQTPPDPERQAALYQFVLSTTLRRLSGEIKQKAIEDAVAKAHAASRQFAPGSGPCAGCKAGSAPYAIIGELIPVQRYLDSLPEESRVALLEVCKEFLRTRRSPEQTPCPFQTEGGCALAERRPLSCRKDGSNDAEISAIELALAVGLSAKGLDCHRVNLVNALLLMLEVPDWEASFAKGGHVLWEAGRFSSKPDVPVEEGRKLRGSHEPSGKPSNAAEVLAAIKMDTLEAREEPFAGLSQESELARIALLRLPYAYSSHEELEPAMERYKRRLREVSVSKLDPVAAFNALKYFDTFAAAYRGEDVRDILSEVGETLICPIVRRALPDLCEPIERRRRGGKYRVGYISSNMSLHNGAYWSLGWIVNHAEDIESYAFSLCNEPDDGTWLFRSTADHFYQVPGDVTQTARFIKSLDLDVLIFTDLGMDGANYQYAGMRLAPVQATAWGHPVTSGLPTIDYYLSSDLMEPENGNSHYREKLVRLPGSGLYLQRNIPSGSNKTRADYGLPEGFLVLLPHNAMKLVPREDELLANISQSLENPIVLIESSLVATTPILKARLERAGVRCQWLGRMSGEDFRRILELADLVIDIPAWNGGNVTLESIAMGTPFATLPGEFMRGRHSLAFLKQAGMDALIAMSERDYLRIILDRDLQAKAMADVNLDGPFEDKEAVLGLDAWIRDSVPRGRQP